MSSYAFTKPLPGAAFDDVLARTRSALLAEGFGIPTEMDTQAIFKAKLGKDSARRVILGACLPGVAFEAMALEPDVAVLLPCNVVVRELPHAVEVTAVDPQTLFTLTERLDPASALEVKTRLQAALERI
ncbi:MAG: DUF302 domain-containing protein [Acidobacteriota bacterium]|nr:DUF302 domain-containing protein [Acidobacteriota bacterium]